MLQRCSAMAGYSFNERTGCFSSKQDFSPCFIFCFLSHKEKYKALKKSYRYEAI